METPKRQVHTDFSMGYQWCSLKLALPKFSFKSGITHISKMGNLCFVKNHAYFLNRLHFTSMGFVEVVGTLSLVSLEGSTKLFVFDSSSQFRNFPILPKMVFEALIIGGLLPSGHRGCDSCLDSVPLLEK